MHQKTEVSQQFTLKVYSRLHMTLLAMHKGMYRMNGGIGFAINEPRCEFAFSRATDFSITDNRAYPLADDENEKIITLLQNIREKNGFANAVEVIIEGNMIPHAGFGSGTAITLACIEALHTINNSNPSKDDLIRESRRGGTSGIGIHTYFTGGCVFDLGRPIDNKMHSPSNHVASPILPLLLDQLPMPDWDFGVCIPLAIPRKTQAEERAFFERICPLESDAVYETLYHTLFGLYPAIREGNRSTFCHALRAIQACAWKQAERQEYGVALSDLEQSLYEQGAEAVGMSSLGPSLFFLAENVPDLIAKMRNKRPDCEWLLTKPANHGRKLSHD
ncbi:MAG: beta-ribofuranosylaminobenzene 5'-phosphate synthase [Methylobacter sp.]|nr:MAG: beta-ribofuranosylaminobenzene 5'-phosphate synthase [Methylobacter sp.]